MARSWSNISYSDGHPGGKLSSFSLDSQPWLQNLGIQGTYTDENGVTQSYEFVGLIEGSNDANVLFRWAGGTESMQKDASGGLQLTVDSTNHTYHLLKGDGTKLIFADFSGNWDTSQKGMLISKTMPSGVSWEVATWENYLPKVLRATYPQPGSDPDVVEELEYTYATGTDRISRITFRRGPSGGTLTTLRTVDYEYYTSTVSGKGSAGDLKNVTIYDGDDTAPIRDQQYYRWYTDTAGGIGYAGGLKMWISGDSYKKASQALGTVETATDANLDDYADNYFEYDTDHRVTKEIAQGAGCSCAGVEGSGQYSFEYSSINDGTGGDLNIPIYKTIEYLPDHTPPSTPTTTRTSSTPTSAASRR